MNKKIWPNLILLYIGEKSYLKNSTRIFHDPPAQDDQIWKEYKGIRLEYSLVAWPGCYPLVYLTEDNGCLCPKCANENINLCADNTDPQWNVIESFINWEDDSLYCDHCNEIIEPAYGSS